MSEYAEAVREFLERDLACRCGAMNGPTPHAIRVDINGVACCERCGRGGPYQIFQPKERHE